MANLASTLDLSKLLLMQAGLSTITAASSRSPSYNLPIVLFGLFVVDKSSVEGLRQFGALQALSLVLDVLWFISGSRETGGLITFLYLINMAAKPVVLLAVATNLKEQGLPNMGSMTIGGGSFGNGPQDQRGTTVWSAEEGTGYQSNAPYQTVDDADVEEIPRGQAPQKKDQGSAGYHTLA